MRIISPQKTQFFAKVNYLLNIKRGKTLCKLYFTLSYPYNYSKYYYKIKKWRSHSLSTVSPPNLNILERTRHYKVMIIHFQTNLKDYVENISNRYKDFDYICPKCGAKHTWRRHGFYERHILYLEDHYLHDHSLKVLRLQCTSCNSTHAILPNNTIPYSIYCLSAFLQITSEVLIHNHSLSQVACHYNISYQLISYFIKRIMSFENECKLVLKELQFFDAMNLSSILQLIMSRPTFPSEYFLYTRWAFLMQKFRFIFPKPVYLGCNIF